MIRTTLLPSLLFAVTAHTLSLPSLTIAPTTSATTIASAILGDGLEILSATLTAPHLSSGIFTSGPLGLHDGGILTTGYASDATCPVSEDGLSHSIDHQQPGSELCEGLNGGIETFDAAVLRMRVRVPRGYDAYVARVVFASKDMFEDGAFNDAMGIWVDGAQIAFDASGNPVTAQSLDTDHVLPDVSGTGYPRSTSLLTARREITEGEHEIQIAICDGGDGFTDSAAFVAIDPCVGEDCGPGVVPPTELVPDMPVSVPAVSASTSSSSNGVVSSASASQSGSVTPSPTESPESGDEESDGNDTSDSDSDSEFSSDFDSDYETCSESESEDSDDEDDHDSEHPGISIDHHKPTILLPGTKTITLTTTALCSTTTCGTAGCHETVFPTPTTIIVTSTATVPCETVTAHVCKRGGKCVDKVTTIDVYPIETPKPKTPVFTNIPEGPKMTATGPYHDVVKPTGIPTRPENIPPRPTGYLPGIPNHGVEIPTNILDNSIPAVTTVIPGIIDKVDDIIDHATAIIPDLPKLDDIQIPNPDSILPSLPAINSFLPSLLPSLPAVIPTDIPLPLPTPSHPAEHHVSIPSTTGNPEPDHVPAPGPCTGNSCPAPDFASPTGSYGYKPYTGMNGTKPGELKFYDEESVAAVKGAPKGALGIVVAVFVAAVMM
ncbi:hypothetical protein EX30DRAFT_398451 [Ascodesmis nigricans]|uniref:Uncharacterized protein n=1 Tax=Ascodesmis nigricans TaxID=341454 RepID=A0A4S2MQK3_9PEZI|nr:hypothetical protein EX30DRAFT_398451 [Ascodesmis nigricans]